MIASKRSKLVPYRVGLQTQSAKRERQRVQRSGDGSFFLFARQLLLAADGADGSSWKLTARLSFYGHVVLLSLRVRSRDKLIN